MRIQVLFTLLVLYVVTAYSQTRLTNLEEISRFGMERNLDYRSALLDLSKAEDDIEGFLTIDETEITTSIEYDNDETSNPELSSEIEIPFFDQFTFTYDVDEDLSGDLEFSFEPFAHSDDKVQSELDYKKALINAEDAYLSAEYNSIDQALSWMTAQKDYVVNRRNWQLEEIIYGDNKSRYDAGDITLDDLKDSLIDWSEARKDFITSEQTYKQSEKDLYEALATSSSEVDVTVITIASLEEALNILKESIDLENIDFLRSSGWRLSTISVESAKEYYNKTWVYEPDLSADLTIPYDEDGVNSDEFSATLSFTMELDDFNKADRDRAQESYQISLLENRLKLNEAEIDFNQAINLLESNKISSDIFKIEYEQAEILYAEAMLLYSRGEYSEIELEESEIYLLEAENNLFNALAAEYISWLDLKQYL